MSPGKRQDPGARRPVLRREPRPGSAERTRNTRLWIAGGVACALVATIAVVASGYDARETPRTEAGVWVAREAGQYARVNTDTGEIDTVRKIEDPSGVVQSGDRSVVLSHGNGRAWPIDAANPLDLGEQPAPGEAPETTAETVVAAEPSDTEDAGAVRMPDGTRDVIGAGRFVGVRTDAGEVYLGELADPSGGAGSGDAQAVPDEAVGSAPADAVGERLESLRPLDFLGEEDAGEGSAAEGASDDEQGYVAAAIAVGADGRVAAYSAEEGTIRFFDASAGEPAGDPVVLPRAARGLETPQLALVGERWVLLDAEGGGLWSAGADPIRLDLQGGGKLQASSDGEADGPFGGAALVADSAGLFAITPDGDASRVVQAEGAPAQPYELDGRRYAAWIGQGSGALWRGEGETVPLAVDDSARDASELVPVFRGNGSRAVLSESRTGMLWTLPDGKAIPLSQWTISDPPKENEGKVVVDDVTEKIPPTAVADEFGVRAGEPAPLPVMLNDFDANKRDVLTIVPESLGERPLPESFGSLQLLPDAQSIVVTPKPGAKGTERFRYRITDGTLSSEPVEVALTVVDDGTNTAPAWCPVEDCQRSWGVPSIVPGGTLVAPLLEGWVDPEGDVMTLTEVRPVSAGDPVRAIVTDDGRLALRHTDPNAGASDIALRVKVSDSRGAVQTRELQVSVRPDAPLVFTSGATSLRVGQPQSLRPVDRVAGGSGAFVVKDAVVQAGADRVRVSTRAADGTIELEASEPGSATLSVTVSDTVTKSEVTGTVRITATKSGSALALPPLRAFVRPLSDSTVRVLDAVPGASTRALSVAGTAVLDGDLQADVIDHSLVRVAGSTGDGGPGRIGAVDVTVAEGDTRARGRLTVFQVADTSAAGVIAVTDSATVRAGQVVDIPVLANDVVAPGERLMLHPEVTGSGTKGELAFASGGSLRYLAPSKAGTYRIGYTVYGAGSPGTTDLGEVYVTVLPQGSNANPRPDELTARVAPGEDAEVDVPLSGVDADGDRVRLVGVDSSDDPQINAMLGDSATSIAVSAATAAEPGTHRLSYSVRDAFGGTGEGVLRVIVGDPKETGSAPIAVTDQVRLVPRSDLPATIRPLDNDIDPARGRLSIVSVEPNVPGGEKNPAYRALADRIDTEELEQGRISVLAGEELGTASYRYTIKSSRTKSTADGLIVVQTSERVGVQAPTVSDTVLNVRDRARLSSGGIDVLTDKVRWATGDSATLELSLWKGNSKGYRVEGSKIVGEYRPKGDQVVFRVTGTDITGTEVSSYGILVIPPLDELRLTLKPGLAPLSVKENQSVDARLADLVDLAPGDTAELRQGSYPVGRAAAGCEATSATSLRYSAGKAAPWSDTCMIQARIAGQESWTTLPVFVNIEPNEPVVELAPLSRTVAPGTSETIDLTDMVGWQGGRTGDPGKLVFTAAGSGGTFQVAQQGSSLVVTAPADAVTGAQESLPVEVSGSGESRAQLTLRVGVAPRDLPRGGTVPLRCTVGASCGATVIGVGGEYDPFAGKQGSGLRLVSVDASGCSVGSFSKASDTAVAVSWPNGQAPGGTCTVGFTVRDAQDRTGQGSIEFDAQGLPAAPTSITQTAYSASSATFSVSLGGGASHPAVSGVSLTGGGSGSCSPSGPATYQCVATGLSNGEKHQFSARAVNAVGESQPSSAVTAWAYRAPEAPTVSVEAVEDRGNTDSGRGSLRVSVSGSRDTKQFSVKVGGTTETMRAPSSSKVFAGLPTGAVTVTATPLTAFEVPPIPGDGSATGGETSREGFVIGAPKLANVSLSTSGKVSVLVQPQQGEGELERSYGANEVAREASCDEEDAQIPGLKPGHEYFAIACMKSAYGSSTLRSQGSFMFGELPPVPGGKLTYLVKPTGETPILSRKITYFAYSKPEPIESPGAKLLCLVDDTPQPAARCGSGFKLDESRISTFAVAQCLDVNRRNSCSETVAIKPEGAATIAWVERASGAEYDEAAPPANPASLLAFSAAAAGNASVAKGAVSGSQIELIVTWVGPMAGLEQAKIMVPYKPKPPDPEPDPDPPTTP